MSDMLQRRENTFIRIEREKEEAKRFADQCLAAESERDEFVGKVEEWIGGFACRDEMDEFDIEARAMMRFFAVVCRSEEPILN
jgi:hypothetical protein